MSVRILKDQQNITDETVKFSRSFGRGYVPSDDISETYVLEYIREGSDVPLTVKFPKLIENNIEVKFVDINNNSLNDQEMTFQEDTNFSFSVVIPLQSLSSLSQTLGKNTLNRQILIGNTNDAGYTIELSPSTIAFGQLTETTKKLVIVLKENVGENMVSVKPTIENPYTITYKNSTGGVRRSDISMVGFTDTNNPVGYVVDVNRTSTAGDVDDYYEIKYNGTDLIDMNGNSLQDRTIELRVTSDVVAVVRDEYITRLVNEFEREINSQNSLNADGQTGLIDIPSVDIRMYTFDANNQQPGARIAQDLVESYYLEVSKMQGISSIDIGGTPMVGGSTNQTQIFGPFTAPVPIMGALQEGTNSGILTIRHYAILKERTESGGIQSSQNRTQEVTFNFSRGTVTVSTDPAITPTEFIDPTTLVKINTGNVTFVRAEKLNGATDSWEDYTPNGNADYALTEPTDDRIRYYYNFGLNYPDGTITDGNIQIRRPNYVSKDGTQIAASEWSNINEQVYGADTFSRLTTTVELALEPYGGKTQGGQYNPSFSVYEFRTISIEDPNTDLTAEQPFSMTQVSLVEPSNNNPSSGPEV